MTDLTEHGAALQSALSQRYGLSFDAVRTAMDAVSRGGGYQAQFSHPELGGMGQWSSGGMTMIGDMFNSGLKNLVANLCGEIAGALAQGSFYAPEPRATTAWQGQSQGGASMQVSGGAFAPWWPADLGQPSSSGSQNALSYAIFPENRRLAVNLDGQITVYDTGEHRIGGVGQQQSGDASWTFTSQFGTVNVAALPVVSGAGAAPATSVPDIQPDPPQSDPLPSGTDRASAPVAAGQMQISTSDQIFAALEKLAALHQIGVLNADEFATKKAELLSRL